MLGVESVLQLHEQRVAGQTLQAGEQGALAVAIPCAAHHCFGCSQLLPVHAQGAVLGEGGCVAGVGAVGGQGQEGRAPHVQEL